MRCAVLKWLIVALIAGGSNSFVWAGKPIVPGTGVEITKVGDDFEGDSWQYFPKHPKSSRNIDKKERMPLATSANGRWMEGPHRGTPDLVKRVPTPPEGLPGSEYSLLIRTQRPGVPKKPTMEPQQDDLMIKVRRRLGRSLSPKLCPRSVVRVYVPPFDRWENRTGASFGYRIDCWGTRPGEKPDDLTQYWPGIFFNFRSETSRRFEEDSAFLTIRGDQRGRDLRGPEITPGWWTLGMSLSPDGQCHFFVKRGLGELTEEDCLGSHFCYGYRADRFDLVFFNIVTFDNGQVPSTPWIIDDPKVYYIPQTASRDFIQRRARQSSYRR
ncbi:MAG: hypothetical protein AAGF97_09925 [Planctomycetota bacterium]